MNSRARLFILNSILITILFCSVSTTTAYNTRDWNVGDELYFDYLISQKEIYVNEAEKIRDTVTYSSSFENKYVITDIIELSREIFVNLSIPMEVEPYPLNWTYTANYSSNVLVDYLFSFEYHWDDVANQSRLTSFHMLGDIFLIVVDPDWDLFNQGLANIGDLDRIIDTVTYNSTTLNITFGDFLDSVPSYQFTGIQGFPGSSISPSTTHEWKFEFNLGNVIYQREYDPVFFEWIFTPYSNYKCISVHFFGV